MSKYCKKDLENLILEQNKSYSAIGEMYGVSGNAIKKAAKRLGIILPKRREVNPNEIFSHPNVVRKSDSFVNRVSDEEFKDIIESSSSLKEIGEKLKYKSNCSCNVKVAILERCSKLGMESNFIQEKSLLDKTKGEVFSYSKNWQSARSSIRRLAQNIYMSCNESPKCAICGYSKHVEVAHIKAVSEFDDTATIREINSIDNLIGLCPNHHWEYDNGILEI